MASLFKMPGRPYWFVQVTLPNGERLPRKSTKETGRRKAERRAAEIEADVLREFKQAHLDQGRAFHRIVENAARLAEEGRLSIGKAEAFIRELRTLANPEHREVSFRTFQSEWVETELKGLSDSHVSNYKGALKKWCAALGRLADAPLTEITVGDLDKAFSVVRKGSTAGTANNALSALREVFKEAVRKRIIEHDPAVLVRRLSDKKADKQSVPRGPFTIDEIRSLLAAAKDEWRGMILFGFHSSLRMMDIAKLTDANVESGLLIVKSAKTGTITRTPLHQQLAAWIDGKTGSFFPSISTKGNTNVSTTFSNLMAKAKVPKERGLPGGGVVTRSFHSLRHSFTSSLADAGIDEATRMALTGHKDSTVHAAYTHHGDDKLKAAIQLLPNL
jgi:integrase